MLRFTCKVPSPVVVDNMRARDRFKPEKRLDPRPEALLKIANLPDGPWRKTGKTPVKRHPHARCYQ